jgi:hypothetical protein
MKRTVRPVLFKDIEMDYQLLSKELLKVLESAGRTKETGLKSMLLVVMSD